MLGVVGGAVVDDVDCDEDRGAVEGAGVKRSDSVVCCISSGEREGKLVVGDGDCVLVTCFEVASEGNVSLFWMNGDSEVGNDPALGEILSFTRVRRKGLIVIADEVIPAGIVLRLMPNCCLFFVLGGIFSFFDSFELNGPLGCFGTTGDMCVRSTDAGVLVITSGFIDDVLVS